MQRIVILNVSTNPSLLETRSLLLRTAGYIVVEQSSTKAAANELLSGDFDAVILCHSITQEQRDRLVNLIRTQRPSTPILIITGRFGQFDRRVDAVVENDPESLLQEVAAILSRAAEGRRAMPRGPEGP